MLYCTDRLVKLGYLFPAPQILDVDNSGIFYYYLSVHIVGGSLKISRGTKMYRGKAQEAKVKKKKRTE